VNAGFYFKGSQNVGDKFAELLNLEVNQNAVNASMARTRTVASWRSPAANPS